MLKLLRHENHIVDEKKTEPFSPVVFFQCTLRIITYQLLRGPCVKEPKGSLRLLTGIHNQLKLQS